MYFINFLKSFSLSLYCFGCISILPFRYISILPFRYSIAFFLLFLQKSRGISMWVLIGSASLIAISGVLIAVLLMKWWPDRIHFEGETILITGYLWLSPSKPLHKMSNLEKQKKSIPYCPFFSVEVLCRILSNC